MKKLFENEIRMRSYFQRRSNYETRKTIKEIWYNTSVPQTLNEFIDLIIKLIKEDWKKVARTFLLGKHIKCIYQLRMKD
ncbi:MAG: hypothetical protein ACTSQY_00915 [Candidatus Odinarchaeia archaeon]